MKNKKALYGVISYTGGQYTVIFEKVISGTSQTTSSLTGYGEFPFADYPNLPVIDYTNNDAVFQSLKLNLYVIESTAINEFSNSNQYVTLDDYLKKVHDLGIKIHNYFVRQ